MHGLPARTVDSSLTLDQYERLPDENEYLLELSGGRLVREPRPGGRHGVIVLNILLQLGPFVREHALGRVVVESGFLLADDPPTVRGPDVAFISAERLPHGPSPDGFWRMAPDLAVEVVSPSNSAAELHEKILQYLECGSRLVWVAQPRTRTVEVWRPAADVRIVRGEESLYGGDVVPGFQLPLEVLFED